MAEEVVLDELNVCPFPVTLNYIKEMNDTLQTGILASKVHLGEATGRVITADGVTIEKGDSFQIDKRGSFFSSGSVRLPGSKRPVAIPSRKFKARHRSHWSIHDVVQYTIKENVVDRGAHGESGLALACILDHKHVYEEVSPEAPVGVYVSVPWNSCFSKFVEALLNHFKYEDPKQVYIWVDFLNVNVFKLEEDEAFRVALEISTLKRMRSFTSQMTFFNAWGFRQDSGHKAQIEAFNDSRVMWEIYCGARLETEALEEVAAKKAELAEVREAFQHAEEDVSEEMVHAVEGELAEMEEAIFRTDVMLPHSVYTEVVQSFRSEGLNYFLDEVLSEIDFCKVSSGLSDLDKVLKHESEARGSELHLAEVQELVKYAMEAWFVHLYARETPKLAKKHDIQYAQVAETMNRVAVIHSKHNEPDEALRLFDYVIEFYKLGQGRDHPARAHAMNNKALLLQKAGRPEDAVPLLLRALEILRGQCHPPATPLQIGRIIGNLINVYEALGDLENAEVQLKALADLKREVLGKRDAGLAKTLNHLGVVQTKLMKIDEAKETLLEALSILEKVDPDKDVGNAKLRKVADDLATVYGLETNHNPDDDGEHHTNVATTLFQLAMVYKNSRAERQKHHEYGQRGLNILKGVLGEKHPQTQRYQEELLSNAPEDDDNAE